MLRKTEIWFGVLFLTVVICAVFARKNLEAQDMKEDTAQFFLIGLYCVDDPNDFPEIATAGFNLVQSYKFEGIPPWGKTDAEAIKYLDAAQRAGLRVLVGMPQEAVQVPGAGDKQDIAFIQQRVRAIKYHPALWAYMMFDEPEHTGYGRDEPIRPTNFNNAYNAIKQVDTVHPVLTVPNGAIDDTYPYLGVDIMILQYLMLPPGNYPYPWDSLENLGTAHSSSFTTLTNANKPFVWTVQAYNLSNDPDMWPGILAYNPKAVGRYPTREEMRFIAYSGLIRGAKGILFTCYKTYDENGKPLEDISCKKNPSQWQAVSSVASELKSISPILLAPQSQIQVTASPDNAEVEFLLKDYKNKLYLIAANPSIEENRTTFTLLQPVTTTIKVLNESRSITPKDVSFTDNFDSYGVHVYEIQHHKSSTRVRSIRTTPAGVEIELTSDKEFPVRNELVVLRIGAQEFTLSRYPESGDTHTLIFTLTLEEFAKTATGDSVTVYYGRGGEAGGEQWNFGPLDKGNLDKKHLIK